MATRYEARQTTDDVVETVAQYRRLTDAAVPRAGTRLRQGSRGHVATETMADALVVTDVATVIIRRLRR
jgi:hypothetical protein